MTRHKHYFFCGIGGSGMMPLALIMRARGHRVEGSDRALDQGRTPEKFEALRAVGIRLQPQDGSGLTDARQILVASAAVEETVPDVAAALRVGAGRMTRAELLAEIFNAAALGIAVGGTSGKSTTTGMLGWILHRCGREATIINGAVMSNFITAESPFASAVPGDPELIVSEVDESDGSIARYTPSIALLNNIAFDHKPLEELRRLFNDFVDAAEQAVVNLDNAETARIADRLPAAKTRSYSLSDEAADFIASGIAHTAQGVAFDVTERRDGACARVDLPMPGAHNVSNALAALATARLCGIALTEACAALGHFKGIRRRLEMVGTAGDVTVIDDFAHNPDKITATLTTLRAAAGRLLIMFQPHGFGPLALMREELIDAFASGLAADDALLMPEPVYFGGTVERKVSSADIAAGITSRGIRAEALSDRAACGKRLLALARPGDRIVVMGARDDTLSEFARELLNALSRR